LVSIINFGKNGNIYNGSNSICTVAEVKNTLYKLFASDGIALKYTDCSDSEEQSFALSCRKINSVCKTKLPSLEESICKTLSEDGKVFMREKIKNVYEGKINRIREEEKGILLEVDRICKKHNINYYLVGGSLLGAVRHNGFIPWDDDVDICMLREDFEKFRKLCPSELAEKYAYQSYRDEKCTHYIYDKIRLKGTYFSSEHSGKYDDMQNGVFLDIFVFDKTANSKLMQKIHIYLIVMLRRLINIRWTKEPVTGKFALISKLILPLICFIPFGVYHSLFEFILRFYEKSNKSRFVLDGIGLYVKKGALPLSWVTDNTPVNFEGLNLPGVKDSDSYLSMWYGDDYMIPPIISKRMSGHSISRLDLGEYLLCTESEKEISLEGELYDK
jgi:lipopolysaccharide cholinephosphotransferase